MAFNSNSSVLLIYTGGTIGMIANPETGVLEPLNFDHLLEHVPELNNLGFHIATHQFARPIDSAEVEPELWSNLVRIIAENYELFDGFVILHGTDTMSYTASALSFMLEGLAKPVILTGSQLPIGTLRTDGKENMITAIEIAAAKEHDEPVVPEVCIFFESHLMRGNRTTKMSAEHFNAFYSANYPALARTGVHIRYEQRLINHVSSTTTLKPHYLMDAHVVVLRIFPGILPEMIEAILNIPNLRGVILESYGAGNAPTKRWFVERLKEATERGIAIINVTQCSRGSVEMGIYKSGSGLLEAGVVSGYDLTTEAALTKLMFLLGHKQPPCRIKELMSTSIRGELTQHEK